MKQFWTSKKTKNRCSAVVRATRRQCQNRATNGSSPFCDAHRSWNSYIDPQKYPIIDSDLEILQRDFIANVGLCYRVKRTSDKTENWVSVQRLIDPEMIDMVEQWDEKHGVKLKVESATPVRWAHNCYVVKWKHYPAPFNTVEPSENLGGFL